MVARAIARSPERVAWTILLGSFLILVALTGTVLVGGRWWLRNASVEQSITMDAGGSTVLVTRPGRSAAEVNLSDIPVNSVIRTQPNAQASLTFSAPGGGEVLGTVRIFGSTIVEISEAQSPRFSTGVDPHRITLHVTSGRVNVTVAVETPRQVRIEIQSDPGAVTVLEMPGSNVSVEAAATETMVTVRDGQATVNAVGGTVALGKDQRAEVIPETTPRGPLPAEQNWVKDGDFATALGGIWNVVSSTIDPTELPGVVEPTTNGGRHTLRLRRTGSNNAHVGVTETINRDVQGLTSLRLNLDILLDAQDLRNCGLYGTECPLMVKIIYVDVGGGEREWLQGFFWFYDPNPAAGLTFCGPCAVRFNHLQWPFGKWQTYTSPDLLTIFASNGAQAATIKSIAIYGEGHTFTSLFTDVQLLANE